MRSSLIIPTWALSFKFLTESLNYKLGKRDLKEVGIQEAGKV